MRCGIAENCILLYNPFIKNEALYNVLFLLFNETQMICEVFSVIPHLGVLLSTNFPRGFYFVVVFTLLFPSSVLNPCSGY